MPITSSTTIPKFKIKEIYPTKQDGREWFINMDNPNGDGIIDAGSSTSKQPDGSWQIECRHTNIKFGTRGENECQYASRTSIKAQRARRICSKWNV